MRSLACGLSLALIGCVVDNLEYDGAGDEGSTTAATGATASESASASATSTSGTDATSTGATTSSSSSASSSSSTSSTTDERETEGPTTSTTGDTEGSTTALGPACGDGHVDPGELCDDGDDDDADGCTRDCLPTPTTIVVGPALGLPVLGDDAGYTKHTDVCAGGLARGVRVTLENDPMRRWVAGLQVRCGKPALAGLDVVIEETDSLPDRKAIEAEEATAAELICPKDQVVVAAHGGAGSVLDSYGVRCAPLVLEPTPGGYLVVAGEVSTLAPHGGAGGDPYEQTCPSEQVAMAGAYVHLGSWLNGYATQCAAVSAL